jgi:spermidine synthase
MTSVDQKASHQKVDRSARFAGATRVLGLLLFLSSCAGLILQIAWQQSLLRGTGATIESTTLLVSAAVLGLGLGSLTGALLSKRHAIASLVLLATVELLSAGLGVASLALLDQIDGATEWLPRAVANLALLLPAYLIGIALPFLMRRPVRHSNHIGNAIGLFYSVIMLGAGVGCILGAAVLLPFLGTKMAIAAAVAINAAVALAAIAAHRRERKVAQASVHPASAYVREPATGFAPVLALAAAAGAVAWSYGIFFVSTVTQMTSIGAATPIATLGPFLLGFAVGSWQAGNHCDLVSPEETMRRAVGTLMKANVLGLLFLPVLSHLTWLDHVVVGVAMLMVFLAARLWGRLLPYLAELGVASDASAGMRTAALYLAHTIGAAAGALLTGYWLLPRMSIVAVALTLVLAGLVGSALVVGLFGFPRWQKLLRGGVIVAVALLALLIIPPLSATVLQPLH